MSEVISGYSARRFLTNSGAKSFNAVKDSADKFKDLTIKLQKELDNGTFDVKELSQDSFNNLEIVLKSLDNTLNQTQDLIKNINESPSDLLLKQKETKYGPGETNEK